MNRQLVKVIRLWKELLEGGADQLRMQFDNLHRDHKFYDNAYHWDWLADEETNVVAQSETFDEFKLTALRRTRIITQKFINDLSYFVEEPNDRLSMATRLHSSIQRLITYNISCDKTIIKEAYNALRIISIEYHLKSDPSDVISFKLTSQYSQNEHLVFSIIRDTFVEEGLIASDNSLNNIKNLFDGQRIESSLKINWIEGKTLLVNIFQNLIESGIILNCGMSNFKKIIRRGIVVNGGEFVTIDQIYSMVQQSKSSRSAKIAKRIIDHLSERLKKLKT